MPRILVTITPEHWDKLRTLARAQYREPRQQIELIVHQALTDALEAEEPLAHWKEVAHALDAQA